MRTWKILRWDNPPEKITKWWALDCPCGYEAEIPSYPIEDGFPIACTGMSWIMEPPGWKPRKNWMPQEIQCRKCKRIYSEGDE